MSDPYIGLITAKWIGGAFFWMCNGFRGRYANQIAEKYTRRNFIAGCILQLLFLLVVVYFLFAKEKLINRSIK
jgi:hypothetical protein